MPRKSDRRVAIALFRGINVGGNKIVKMEELRTFFAKLGYDGAKTLIQSGNVVFRSEDAPAKAAKRIADGFKRTWPFDASIMVRSLDEWREMIGANPFKAAAKDPKRLHIGCLASELSAP